jgi:hypothetical protein
MSLYLAKSKDSFFKPQHQCQSRATSAHIQSFGIRAALVTADCGTCAQHRVYLIAGFCVPIQIAFLI